MSILQCKATLFVSMANVLHADDRLTMDYLQTMKIQQFMGQQFINTLMKIAATEKKIYIYI